MKKIYLLIVSLFMGLLAAHADDFYIYGNFGDGGWKYYKLEYYQDQDDTKTNYYNQIKFNGNDNSNVDFLICKGFGSQWFRRLIIDGKVTDGEGDITNGGYSMQVSKDNNGQNFTAPNLQKGSVYYFTYYPSTSWVKITLNNSDNKNPVEGIDKDSSSDDTDDSDDPKNVFSATEGDGKSYYFYGDMNRWSTISLQGDVTVEDNDHNDITKKIFTNGVYDKYVTTADLNKYWKFKPVPSSSTDPYRVFISQANQYSEDGKSGDWLYLDFTTIPGTNGCLMGQFKITKGDYTNGNNWGISRDKNNPVSYLKTAVVVGNNNTAGYKTVAKEGLQNIMTEANYIKDAVIYFNPSTGRIYLDGTPEDCYVYYAIEGGSATIDDIKTWQIANMADQVNYYYNIDGFNPINSDAYNFGGNRNQNNKYVWESVANATCNVNGREYTNVLRRRIPSSASYRYPTPIYVSLTDQDTEYGDNRIMGKDIWFINTGGANINVYFRYNDEEMTKGLDWVCYNVFSNNLGSYGEVTGYDYLFGGKGYSTTDTQPLIKNNKWGAMQLVEINEGENAGWWWKSPAGVPAEFAFNTWAMFGDSRGNVYPSDRVRADNEKITDLELKGQDLFFTAPAKENPEIVYSHLNGTYSLGKTNKESIQINAEFFDPDHDADYKLVSDTKALKYSFAIYYEGQLVAGSTAADGTVSFRERPYYNWDLNGKTLAGNDYKPGYYMVVVRAEYGDQVYESQDTYAIYE